MLSSVRLTASKKLSTIISQTRMASTMKSAVVAKGPKVTIKDIPIPKPGPYQVVTKIVYSGSNPKDWKRPQWMPDKEPVNQGDDISGVVHEVGENVSEFKPGDRVIAFHEMMAPGGSYAEYGLSWAHTTIHLPNKISFEEGAAVPLAGLTAAVGLFARLRLPEPWLPAKEPIPLIIYGAASAVGAYAIQLAKRANIHPLICVAGGSAAHVENLIDRSKGDTIIDYRKGDEAVVQGFKDAASKHGKIACAFDAVSDHGSYQNIAQALDSHGRITFVLPGKEYEGFADTVVKTNTTVGAVHGTPDDLKEFGYVYFKYIQKGLEEGWFRGQPQEIIPGGLEGVEQGLTNLKDGKAKAVKYIYKIADTPGVSS